MKRHLICLGATLLICLSWTSPTWAENEGLESLDQAIELKLSARTIADMRRVAGLLEQALEEGLDEGNSEFAIQMLTYTLLEQAQLFTNPIFETETPDQRWAQLRQATLPLLERAVEVDDQFAPAYLLLARLHALPNGDQEVGLAAANSAVELLDDNEHASELSLALTTRASLSLDNEDDRMADLNRAIEVDPANNDAYQARALLYVDMGDLVRAIADLEAMLELDPENVLTHQILAEVLAGLDRFEDAIAQLNQAIELAPQTSFNYTYRARMHILNDDYESAMEDAHLALEINPNDLGGRMLRSRLHLYEEDWVRAMDDVNYILARQPGLPEALLLRSMVYGATERWDRAIADVERLLQIDPGNSEFLMQLAALHQISDRPRRAIEIYDQVLNDEEENTDALQGKADCYLSIGDHQGAIDIYDEILTIEPEDDGTLNNLAWVLSTSPEDEVRDGDRALELALQACDVTDYNESHILSTLAAAYAESGDFELARQWAAKAVEMGQEERPDIIEQLEAELESYNQDEPWRELQDTEEAEEPELPEDDEGPNVF